MKPSDFKEKIEKIHLDKINSDKNISAHNKERFAFLYDIQSVLNNTILKVGIDIHDSYSYIQKDEISINISGYRCYYKITYNNRYYYIRYGTETIWNCNNLLCNSLHSETYISFLDKIIGYFDLKDPELKDIYTRFSKDDLIEWLYEKITWTHDQRVKNGY